MYIVAEPSIFTALQTAMEFQKEYEVKATMGGYEVTDFAVRLYDILWALALALNNTITMLDARDISGTNCDNATGELVPLERFNYTNEKVGCVIQFHLQNTNFSGGSVSSLHLIGDVTPRVRTTYFRARLCSMKMVPVFITE